MEAYTVKSLHCPTSIKRHSATLSAISLQKTIMEENWLNENCALCVIVFRFERCLVTTELPLHALRRSFYRTIWLNLRWPWVLWKDRCWLLLASMTCKDHRVRIWYIITVFSFDVVRSKISVDTGRQIYRPTFSKFFLNRSILYVVFEMILKTVLMLFAGAEL